jgi:hypothetical protein
MSLHRTDDYWAYRLTFPPKLSQQRDPEQPTRVTVHESDATEDALMARWLTLDEAALVDLEAHR